MKPGSEAHKNLYCRSFVEGHEPYDVDRLAWPELDEHHVELLRILVPLWADALRDENGNGEFLSAFSRLVSDPTVNEAVQVQAREESRHGHVLASMLERYGIEVPSYEPRVVPDDLERAFIQFGFTECADFFFGCGFFEIVRESRFFPEGFLAVFERFLDEEARHVVFFVNWLAARNSTALLRRRPLLAALGYSRALKRLAFARGEAGVDTAHLPTGADQIVGLLTPVTFIQACVSGYDRRMEQMEPHLLRPRLLPTLSRLALPVLRLLPS